MRASDRAYAALREDIIEWRLRPGTVLAEVEQSERLRLPDAGPGGVGPAHRRRTDDGGRWARRRRYRYFLDSIDELFELRETLEVRAAALAAQRGEPGVFAELQAQLLRAPDLLSEKDPARHEYYALVGRLDEAIDAAISNSYRQCHAEPSRPPSARRLAADDAAAHAAAAEHAAIAEAIAAGNPRLAEAATTLHLHRSLTHVKAAHVAR